ncbi:chaperonin 10-like protein [Powellomyces hirtus]|nr:chaperonin 10-like protein [Powellomyces hirtus]
MSTPTTMQEALIDQALKVSIVTKPIPTPLPGQLVIRVIFSGTNPKDWKLPEWFGGESNQGDDIAGYVHAVGDKVKKFRVGDRVAAFHEMMKPGGSYAEYAVAWEHTTFHLPEKTSFEEAATIPLAALTAALGLYDRLRLPLPWWPLTEPTPLIIYGAASAVGAFAIKLAIASNIHPILAVAGKSTALVESLIDRSKGDTIINYQDGDEAVVNALKSAVPEGVKIRHAFDATSEHGSYVNIAKALDHETGKLTLVLPGEYKDMPKTVKYTITTVGDAHAEIDKASGKVVGGKQCARALYELMADGLVDGWFSAHPHKVVEGGLSAVESTLKDIKAGKVHGYKYVIRIGKE